MTPYSRLPDDAIDLSQMHSILVIKLRHHGDVLLTAPVLSALRAAAPAARIDALVYAETADMLSGHPALAALHWIDRDWKHDGALAQWRAERALLRTLRARRYDLVVHLTEHRRGAWLTRLLRPRWSVAPLRADAGRFWRNSFTHYYSLLGGAAGSRRHTVEKNLDALRRIGVQPGPERAVVLVPGLAAEQAVDALLRDRLEVRLDAPLDVPLNPPAEAPRGFIHVHPGSRWRFKCWPPERMAQLFDSLLDGGETLVVTAAPDAIERAMLNAIFAAMRRRGDARLIDLSGQLSLKGLAALTARARAFVGVDSAPMHIAAAMGTPVVALFGPSGDIEWGPWQVPHRVVASGAHRCRPCGLDGCGGGKISECIDAIEVRDVLTALHELGVTDRPDLNTRPVTWQR